METERKLLKIPLGFRSKIPRRGIYEYQRPENFAKHNALCKRDENYGILMGKPNNAICLDYDIYDPNCKEKQKYTLEYFKKVCGDDVYISRTPSGGYHAVFRYEARFDTWKNATKINGFIDIRTTGGYICGNGCETEKGSYCRLNGNILKLTNMPDILYDMVEENANFAVRERTETKPMHQNVEKHRIPGDINTELQHLGFSGIYWTTSYGFKCDQNSGECPLCGKISHFSNNFRVTKHVPTGDWARIINFQEHKFVQEWADDPNKKAFRKMDVVPKDCPPDVYNLWDGYDIEKKKFVSEETGDIQPFLDLLWDMSGGEESVQEYLLKWIAFLFQNPEKKPKTALVFQSKEGSGKNEFWGFVGKLMGKATYLETSNAERDIFEKHSLALQGRNSRLLVLVKKEERRFVLVEVRGGYLPNTPNHKPFWSNWFRWKNEEQNQLAVYKYLMSIETSEEYIITSRPKTRYYRETIQKCLPPEIKWLEHFVCEEFPQTFCSKNRGLYQLHPMYDSKVSSGTLVSSYAVFVRGWKMSEPTDAQFGNKIKDMVEREGLPFTKGRNEYGRIAWIFSRRGVYDWLTEMEYTEYLLGNEDDEYGGMTPPVRTEY
ncbi:unnamed protein product [Bathycoccus prasinos]